MNSPFHGHLSIADSSFWYQRRQTSCFLFLYSTGSFVVQTLGFCPLVSLLSRFDSIQVLPPIFIQKIVFTKLAHEWSHVLYSPTPPPLHPPNYKSRRLLFKCTGYNHLPVSVALVFPLSVLPFPLRGWRDYLSKRKRFPCLHSLI